MEHRNGFNTAILSQTLDGSPGSYALRELIRDIPLSTDENGVQAHITCVDAWNGNLYIGTSSGEVLHYVAIPSDPSADDGDDQPSYIFATKIEPPYTNQQEGPDAGVKQILLLPTIDKACILCNATLTFYTLPELSPAFGGRIKQGSCLWVGGLDRDSLEEQVANRDEEVIVICLRQRLRLISIGNGTPQKIRDIELGGVTAIERRGDLACVANGETYSLLDVVNQRQNVLFPISSLADSRPLPSLPQETATPSHSRQASRTFSPAGPAGESRGHERNISASGTSQNGQEVRAENGSPWPARGSSRQAASPAQPSSRTVSPTKDTGDTLKPASLERSTSSRSAETIEQLLPNLVSPTDGEFFLTTGTRTNDPGIGMFVNLDGDVVRGTIEFSSYPESLVLDGYVQAPSASQEGYILAVVRKAIDKTAAKGIEIQRWDVDPGESYRTKEWIPLSASNDEGSEEADHRKRIGLRNASSTVEIAMSDISTSLRSRRLRIQDPPEQPDPHELRRNQEEDNFTSGFSKIRASVLLFEEGRVSWVLRNPMILQLDHQLNATIQRSDEDKVSIDIRAVQRVVNSIRGQEARNELEFLTLTYVRQKASLLLFGNLLVQTLNNITCSDQEKRRVEETLIDGNLDPRPLLTLVSPLQEEIAEGPHGIWLPQGLRDVIQLLHKSADADSLASGHSKIYEANVLSVTKTFLLAWRRKKGFGSVADEAHVFHTVDAALLHTLLLLDASSPRGPAETGSLRAELNAVVDAGVTCFDRAVALFESFGRLYVLSRLYQHAKQSAQVLATWRRILADPSADRGGELVNGEVVLQSYLGKIKSRDLVREHGAWLAGRNPELGAAVFANESARVRFTPAEALSILREHAPRAVKAYLELLVFRRGSSHHTAATDHIDDLVAVYLDSVLAELARSPDSRARLVASYATYRALPTPKPPYRQFLADEEDDDEGVPDWWQDRLRLLQLIGGRYGPVTTFDAQALEKRLAPYATELVPETIILRAREGAHEAALRLLAHDLGDYDTAVRYCLLGGENIFYPRTGAVAGNREVENVLPDQEVQSALFGYLLREYFAIENVDERLERTAELLERFGGWFDVVAVLEMIPEEWSVALVAGFLTHAFRRLVRERHETEVVKALSSAQNLRRNVEFIGVCEKAGPTVVANEEVVEVR